MRNHKHVCDMRKWNYNRKHFVLRNVNNVILRKIASRDGSVGFVVSGAFIFETNKTKTDAIEVVFLTPLICHFSTAGVLTFG